MMYDNVYANRMMYDTLDVLDSFDDFTFTLV